MFNPGTASHGQYGVIYIDNEIEVEHKFFD